MMTEQMVKDGFSAMKRINRMFWTLAAATVVAACAEEVNPSSSEIDGNLVQMTLSASSDTELQSKTTYLGRKVYWEAEDEISVFSIGTEVVKTGFAASSVSEDKTTATFTGLAAPGAETYLAVYPHSDANAFDLASQTLTVCIPTDQVAVANGFASGANVSVALSMPSQTTDSETEVAEPMKFKNVAQKIIL